MHANLRGRLLIDFGPEIGMKRSSAQLTTLYAADDLLEKQVLAVVNFPPRQIANFFSEVLVLGLEQEHGGVTFFEISDEIVFKKINSTNEKRPTDLKLRKHHTRRLHHIREKSRDKIFTNFSKKGLTTSL